MASAASTSPAAASSRLQTADDGLKVNMTHAGPRDSHSEEHSTRELGERRGDYRVEVASSDNMDLKTRVTRWAHFSLL